MEDFSGADTMAEAERVSGDRNRHSDTIKIQGLNLTGSLCRLDNLRNWTKLDVSSNNIIGEIPYGLPPNVTHNICAHAGGERRSRQMKAGQESIKTTQSDLQWKSNIGSDLDLSYNNLSGDLPESFGYLTNLARLFLQNNRFTGSVAYLDELPLKDYLLTFSQ
ncbi:hypothetical protein TSUD_330500 [Trifolium subterraneum]|nr:hypothetical protein TSUD_330500 [Trifolium subterraneum]